MPPCSTILPLACLHLPSRLDGSVWHRNMPLFIPPWKPTLLTLLSLQLSLQRSVHFMVKLSCTHFSQPSSSQHPPYPKTAHHSHQSLPLCQSLLLFGLSTRCCWFFPISGNHFFPWLLGLHSLLNFLLSSGPPSPLNLLVLGCPRAQSSDGSSSLCMLNTLVISTGPCL